MIGEIVHMGDTERSPHADAAEMESSARVAR